MERFELVGQGDRLKQLMRSVQTGRIVHALLLAGPRGTGKRTAANLFAQTLLCRGENKPCGQCPACKQFENGNHPDVRYIRPEPNTIKVEAVRELIDYLSMSSYEGGAHVAIIERAERMNESAQNALLKTLEEPIDGVMFFLLSEAPEGLLPTIRSRCQLVRLSPLDVAQCGTVLKERGLAPDRAGLLAGLSQGSVGRALEIDGDEGFFPLRDQVLNVLEKITKPEMVLKAAKPLNDAKDNAMTVLEIMELWARDLMLLQNGAEPFESGDIEMLRKSKNNGKALLQSVLHAREELDRNVAWAHIVETLAFGVVAAKH